jgi:hypothetical protein
MKLSAPSVGIFLLSTVIIGLLIAARYFGVDLPILTAVARSRPFEVTLVAWFLLFLGVAFNL